MALSLSTGIFTGIETGKIIDQLMAVDRRPLDQLTRKKASNEASISYFGSLSSLLSGLKSVLSSLKKSSIMAVSAAISDSSVFTASASSSAVEGAYNIKVNNIATSQSIYSQSFESESAEVADISVVEQQKIKIRVGNNEEKVITIDSSNNTLSGIRDAINTANAGARASVINDGTGYRLILSSSSTGASNRIVVTVDEDSNGVFQEDPSEIDGAGLSRLAFNAEYDANGGTTGGILNMTQSQAAVNASLIVNGLTVTRGVNSINDLITGVTINLLKDSSGSAVKLNIAKDSSRITGGINAFISSYKAIVDHSKKSPVQSNSKAAYSNRDNTVRTIVDGLKSAITSTYAEKTLLGLGLNHDKNGVLSLNSTTLENAIKENPHAVIDTLDAMAVDLETKINNFMNRLIPARTDGFKNSIKFIENKMEVIERMLEKRETEYRKKFGALEKTVGELQRSSELMNKEFTSLSNIYGGRR